MKGRIFRTSESRGLTLKESRLGSDSMDMDLQKVRKREPFLSLFPINPEIRKSIAKEMKANGYDPAHPVIIWKEKNILIDGHTRCEAAKEAGIKTIKAIYESFPTEEAALRYAYGLQFKRRNLTDADKLQFTKTYLNKVGQKTKRSSGWKKKELGEILCVSLGTAQKFISVAQRGTDNDMKAVSTGTLSINGAYNSLLDREKAKKQKDLKVSLDQKEKDPARLTLSVPQIKDLLVQWARLHNQSGKRDTPYKHMIMAIDAVIPESSALKGYGFKLIERKKEVKRNG